MSRDEQGILLFSPGSVVLATALGTVLAGSLLIAINFRRLGQSEAPWATIALGVVALAILGLVVSYLPEQVPEDPAIVGLGAAQLPAAYLAVTRLQGGQLVSHREAGGRFSSAWIAAGIGFLVGNLLSLFLSLSVWLAFS